MASPTMLVGTVEDNELLLAVPTLHYCVYARQC